MTTPTLTWNPGFNFPADTRFVKASDSVMTYWAKLPEGMTLDQAIEAYESTADYDAPTDVSFVLMYNDYEHGYKDCEIS
jgi:hypothetical protein